MKRVRIGFEDVKVACLTDRENVTGATALLFERGAVGTAFVLGGSPGTRGMDALFIPGGSAPIYGFVISGGSTQGLDVAMGVARFLKEENIGVEIDSIKLPTVASCVIFDLFIGRPVPPRPDDLYKACLNASKEIPLGSYGAGTGAVVGKIFTARYGMKGGQGYAEMHINGIRVGCLAVVNAFGDVSQNEKILAGARDPKTGKLADTQKCILSGVVRKVAHLTDSTTICVVITDATLDKIKAHRVAVMAASYMPQIIRPAWTVYDGDMVVVLSIGNKKADITFIGTLAGMALKEACLKAVLFAESLENIPSCREIGLGL